MPNYDFSQDRLSILQRTDLERRWYTIDDKRVCLICERVISGRDIRIVGGPENYSLACPTPDCPGTFTHWRFYRPSASRTEGAAPPPGGLESFFFASDSPGDAVTEAEDWKILGEESAS